jgi:hypothetical protein
MFVEFETIQVLVTAAVSSSSAKREKGRINKAISFFIMAFLLGVSTEGLGVSTDS